MSKILQKELTELQLNKQNIQIKSEEVILRFIIFHKYNLPVAPIMKPSIWWSSIIVFYITIIYQILWNNNALLLSLSYNKAYQCTCCIYLWTTAIEAVTFRVSNLYYLFSNIKRDLDKVVIRSFIFENACRWIILTCYFGQRWRL